MTAQDQTLVPDALEYLDPAYLDYQEWLEVGMALHAEGYPAFMWDQWSQSDVKRYRPGECFSKWAGFGNGYGEIAGGTIVKMAMDRGFTPPERPDFEADAALEWDAPIIDMDWIEPVEVAVPDNWDPIQDVKTYLSVMFDPEDIVGYVTSASMRDGRWLPKGKGDYVRTAGELLELLENTKSLERTFGSPNNAAGAWIRVNPLTGEGVRNVDVADFRHVLVESDSMSIEEQRALIEELQLPCTAIVHSGGKSLHALVKIEAKDYTQYRERVEKLYRVCAENGFTIDGQNKNPSRLSRLPGFLRKGERQFIVATNTGKGSWREWADWIDEQTDELPDAENLAKAWDNLPELSPPLIDGVLRQGHKMLLAGPSKAGKSFALIELCVAIAEGLEWFGFQCSQGRVLYVNLELDQASCLHRFRDVYTMSGTEPRNLANIDIWNLRGRSKPMDELAAPLIRRALKTRPAAVIIDPIYKVITGDENSADQMARFCNQFDRVATEVGCAVIYCHHHSKGAQGGKRSADRASGSGVFARDPDAQLDMIQLPLSDDAKKARENARRCEALCAFADGFVPGWRSQVSEDDILVADKLVDVLRGIIGNDRAAERAMLGVSAEACEKAHNETAWRIEGILREFAGFEPINMWFDYPLHAMDETGILGDIDPETDKAPWQRRSASEKRQDAAARKKDRKAELMDAVANAAAGEPPTVKDIANYLDLSEKTINRRIKEFNFVKNRINDSIFTVSLPGSDPLDKE